MIKSILHYLTITALILLCAIWLFGRPSYAVPPGPIGVSAICGNASLSVTTSSARVVIPVLSNCNVVTLLNDGTDEMFVKLGDGSVTAATTDIAIPGGRSLSIPIGNALDIAAIMGANSSVLRVYVGNGSIQISRLRGTVDPPPPLCSNTLDFSVTCNSQYVGLI